MNLHPRKHKLMCWLMCLSLIVGLLPVVPPSAQALAETAPKEEYTIFKGENGVPQMVSARSASANLTHVADGRTETWYSLYEDLSADTLTVSGGSINLILCDGATLIVNQTIRIAEGSRLTIWGQPAQGGKLVASSIENKGELTVNGGNLETSGELAINGGGLTINGGRVSANGLKVDKALTVSSGFLESTGSIQVEQNAKISGGFVISNDFYAKGCLTINGGQVKSSLECDGTMSVTNATVITDKANAPASITSGVLVNQSNDKLTGTVIGNPTLSTDLVVFKNMKLDIPKGQTLTMATGTTLTNLGTVTGEGTINASSVVNAEGCSIARINQEVVTTAKPLSSCKRVNNEEEPYYIGDNGVYVLNQDLTMSKLVVTKDVKPTLILPNGLTLTTGSVSLPVDTTQANGSKNEQSNQTTAPYTLTLSKQSGPFGMLRYNNESAKKTLSFNDGNLIVEGGMISGNGAKIEVQNLTVNGGAVSAAENGIDVSGTLTVNGGSVQGTSQIAKGIFAESLEVKGGSVTGQNMKEGDNNHGLTGNKTVTISSGTVAIRDTHGSTDGTNDSDGSDLGYKRVSITGGVLLACDEIDMGNWQETHLSDAVIMTKKMTINDAFSKNGSTGVFFEEQNGKLVGSIKYALKNEQLVGPVLNTGFTIPEGAVLKIDSGQTLKLENGAVVHNKGAIINWGTINDTDKIIGNQPIIPIDTDYMKDGTNTPIMAMVLDQKLLDLYGGQLPREGFYILQGQITLELAQSTMPIPKSLNLILEDGAEVHLKSNGFLVSNLQIWGQEKNTGKLIHDAPLTISNGLALHGGGLSCASPSDSTEDSLIVTKNEDSEDSLTVTGGPLCENGISVAEGNATLTGGTIRCTNEAAGLTLKKGELKTGPNGTGWLIGNVLINNKLLSDYSPYSGVFIHDNVEEVRGAQALNGDYTVPANHTMTVYGSLDIPAGLTLSVGGTLKLAEKAVLTREGTLQGAVPVTLAVKNGTWDNGSKDNRIAEVLLPNDEIELNGLQTVSYNKEQDVSGQLPTGMKPDSGYAGGSWDKTVVSGANQTLTYTFTAIPSSGQNEIGPKPPKPPVAPETPALKPGETVTETKPDGTKVEASKDENGNTTVTETKKDGTVIKSEEKANGDKTVTETRKDGSSVKSEEKANGDKTITETNKDGSSVKSEEKANGDKAITETNKDGSSVKSEKKHNGDKIVTKTDKTGASVSEGQKLDGTTAKSTTDTQNQTKAEVKVSDKAAEQAVREKKPVELPLPPMTPAQQDEKQIAPVINVELPKKEQGEMTEIKVTIPMAAEASQPGTVAVIVHEDGSEEVIRKASMGSDSIKFPLEASATIKLVNNAKQFKDVSDTHWAWKEVTAVTANEIFNGTGDGLFSPDGGMSRGMLAVVLHNLEDNPDRSTADFIDVEPDQWYSEAIGWAVDEGIVSGVGNDRFAPNDMLTREQLAVMLYNYAGAPTVENEQELTFPDCGNISSWASEAMAWAVEQGIISGMGDGSLAPQGAASRAQVATMMTRFISL